MTFPIPLLRAVTLAIALLAGSAAAHEGHDHGGQADAFPKAGSTPRLESTSGPFELVALLQKGELVASDAPEGPAANVARLYAAFAADLRNGTPGQTAPDFAHALRLHRTLDLISAAAASGIAQHMALRALR